MIRPTRTLAAAPLLLLTACLEPMVSDEVPPEGLLLPAGSAVPNGHDDPQLDRRIDEHDGVEGEIPLLAGFAEGEPIGYWSFGEAPAFAAPIFLLVRGDGDEVEMVDHKAIVADIPGDPGYSPYWAVWFVEVTDAYGGELITSTAALDEAERLGLVGSPVQQPETVNCPVIANGVTLEVGGGNPALGPNGAFYWAGVSIQYYNFGPMAMVDNTLAAEAPIYRLRREGGEPLSEPVRHVDMTGDGDLKDSNDLFVARPADESFTPHSRLVEVVVPAGYQSIDDSQDQTVADFRDASDLFDPDPVAGNVVSYQESSLLFNLPQQQTPGEL